MGLFSGIANKVQMVSGALNKGFSKGFGGQIGNALGNAAKGFSQSLRGNSGGGGGGGNGFSSGKFFTQKYNEVSYKVELWLDNSGNFDQVAQKVFPINPAAVMNLSFSDMVNTWNTEGSIIFMYSVEDAKPLQEMNLSQSIKTMVSGAQENTETLNSYQFRGDGFDLLRFVAVPIVGKDPDSPGLPLPIDERDPNWILSFLFSIYDIEDINDVPGLKGPTSSYLKCLKLYFHDVRYQFLRSTNIEYSTALSPEADFNSKMSNEGVLLTGKTIMEIWNKSIGNSEIGGSQEFFLQEDEENWDVGAGKIFYTSPAAATALDDLEYVMSHHVSKDTLDGIQQANDLCLLSTNRPKSLEFLEQITLKPLSKYFKEALEGNKPGKLQLEHFFVTSHTEDGGSTKISYKAPIILDDSQTDRDLKTFKYGQIISYSFVDMSPEMNSLMFSTSPVYSVDIGKRTFNTKFTNNDVESARKAIAETYIQKLFKEGSNNEELFLPTLHKHKKTNTVFPKFTLYGEQIPNGDFLRQKPGLHDLLYTGLFQNACICFKTFGLSLRRAGSFIAIDKTGGCTDTDFNNKLYGQWFVLKVDHSFEAGAYMNAIYAIKIHRFKTPKLTFQETI
jgi:hypothetical protein